MEYKLPELGEGISEGTVAKVLIEEGDVISEGQPLLELETDKAVLEVPSTVSGTVQKVAVKAGGKAQVGEVIFEYQKNAGDGSKEESQTTQESNEAPEEKPAESTSDGIDSAQSDKSASSDKATIQSNKNNPPQDNASVRLNGVEVSSPSVGPVPAAPSTRRLARELGVDIHQVSGSGPGGRISQEDIKQYVKSAMQSGGNMAAVGAPVQAAPLPDFSKWGEVERQAFSGIRNATINQMTRSWTAPHVTQFDKADITDLEKFRKSYAKKSNVKITVTALLLKVAVAALRKFPQFNSSLDLNARELVLKKYFHVGVAVDTDRGLLVPVIRDVNTKSVSDLAVELGDAAERARDRKLSLDEMQGGCFTITNLGGIGGTNFTPIVNTPEVAILGVARGGIEPVWNSKEFEPRFMLPLSLSYDHRAIDGADGARFLRYICEVLENPLLLALEG